MQLTILPSIINGTLQAPSSKSSMQRACAAALLTKGSSTIYNPGHSNDDKAALDIIQKLGATVAIMDDHVFVKSMGVQPTEQVINCGESGLSIRMFSPIAALSFLPIIITGQGSLASRPMHFFDEIFPSLGIKITSTGGNLPLTIQGPLVAKNVEMDGSLSSQFLTGLLMAYSAAGASDVSIKVKNLKSKPYIDLTLKVMQDFGMKVPQQVHHETYYFKPNHPTIAATELPKNPVSYTVEGDWSGAAFLLVAGAIAGNIIVKGLDVSSTQADKAIIQALQNCGAAVAVQPEQIEVSHTALKPFYFNATHCPDLFPPLVALAAYCNGKTTIEGTSRLAHKESNRAITLQEEFGKMGLEITLQNDLMIIDGGNGLRGGVVSSRHDHRIAMACAVAALKANGETTIDAAEAINKSYPNFYDHIKYLGANIVAEI